MSNRAIRKAILSLRLRISEHEHKIVQERTRPNPDEGVITHWLGEIRVFEQRLRRLEDRLARRRGQ
jgi:hypothetical protein